MMRPLSLRLVLPLAVASIAWLPQAARADEPVVINEVSKFKGTATDIGVLRGDGNQVGGIEYRIEGIFVYEGELNLGTATLTLHHLLDEIHGNGEFVLTTNNADLVCPIGADPEECTPAMPPMPAAKSGKPTEGKYETPSRFRPQVRAQIKNKNGVYQFNIRLDRGLSPQVPPDDPRRFPIACEPDPFNDDGRDRTAMRTAFALDDGVNPPVIVDFVKLWECAQPGRYHLRSR